MQSIYSRQHKSDNVSPFLKTYILYNPKDFLSVVSAYLAMLPFVIIVVYLTLIYCRREFEVISIYIGQVISQFLNMFLKRKIRQPRPSTLIKGYGMPSNHAQFVSYLAGYMILWLFFRARNLPKFYYVRNIMFYIILVVSTCFSRVYLNYHTVWQVVAGVLVGTAFSALWFSFILLMRRLGVVNWLLNLKLNKYFYIRDMMDEEHQLLEKEWQEWKQRQTIQPKEQHPDNQSIKSSTSI